MGSPTPRLKADLGHSLCQVHKYQGMLGHLSFHFHNLLTSLDPACEGPHWTDYGPSITTLDYRTGLGRTRTIWTWWSPAWERITRRVRGVRAPTDTRSLSSQLKPRLNITLPKGFPAFSPVLRRLPGPSLASHSQGQPCGLYLPTRFSEERTGKDSTPTSLVPRSQDQVTQDRGHSLFVRSIVKELCPTRTPG